MRDLIHIDQDNTRIDFLDNRFYFIDGKFKPSVTTILSAYPKGPHYYKWLKDNGHNSDIIMNQAGERGSVVHNLTEEYDKGKVCSIINSKGEVQYKQDEWAMFERYVEFRNRFKDFKIQANELHLLGEDYAGTLDRVFEYNNELWLVDIKTSNNIYNHYWLQQAAYAYLWNTKAKRHIDRIAILWLNAKTRSDGRGEAIQGVGWQLKTPQHNIEHYFRLFNKTFALWSEENKGIAPRNKSYKISHKQLLNHE